MGLGTGSSLPLYLAVQRERQGKAKQHYSARIYINTGQFMCAPHGTARRTSNPARVDCSGHKDLYLVHVCIIWLFPFLFFCNPLPDTVRPFSPLQAQRAEKLLHCRGSKICELCSAACVRAYERAHVCLCVCVYGFSLRAHFTPWSS